MEPDSSKVRLRAAVRSRRATRQNAVDLAEAGPGFPSHVWTPPGADDLDAADVRGPSVARAALSFVAALWPDDDLSGRVVVAYAALRGEPDLDPLIDELRRRGARVFLPVVTSVGEALKFGEVTGPMAALAPQGRWGIREPEPQLSATELFAEAAPDLIFVPALGFGAGGARLGNGAGFYDRTFGPQGEAPLKQTARVVGVCYSEETNLPGLDVEPWDLRIDEAITEDGLRRL